MSAYLAEFIGTFLLIFLGNGVVAGVLLKQSKSENAGWIVIVLAWGLAVSFAIYAVGKFSGAHINPAVTLALAAVGEFPSNQVAGYIAAQMGGAMSGAVLVWWHYLPHWGKTADQDLKLAVFSTAPAINKPFSNLLSEILGTFVLVGGIMAIGANDFTEGLNPLVIGGLIALIGFSLGGTTGFAINPARDLGPRLAHAILPIPGKGSSNWSYSWIPIVGPCVGGILGATVYQAAFLGHSPLALYFVLPFTIIIMVLSIFENKSAGLQ